MNRRQGRATPQWHTEGTAPRQRGFTLLEVILALAVFGVGAALLGELARQGTSFAANARDMTQAQLLCESVMAELVGGARKLEGVTQAPLQLDSTVSSFEQAEWVHSVELLTVRQANALNLRVTVRQNLPLKQRPAEFVLTRLMVNPNALNENAPEEEEEESSTSSGSSSSGSSSSGSSGGTSGSSGT